MSKWNANLDIWTSLVASKKIVNLWMNPPILSLYSEGSKARKQITALYLFFQSFNLPIHLFSIYFSPKQQNSIKKAPFMVGDLQDPLCFVIHSLFVFIAFLTTFFCVLCFVIQQSFVFVFIVFFTTSFCQIPLLFVHQLIYLASTLFVFPGTQIYIFLVWLLINLV